MRAMSATLAKTGLALSALSVPPVPQADRIGAPTQVQRLERELEDLRVALKIPGISIAVVKDGELLWATGLGFADLEQRQRATEHTLYPIASLTKPFAATLALQLLEQNKLSLDDPLSKYHADFQTDRVRVRHILTHTAAAFAPGMKPGDKYEYSGAFFGYLAPVIEKCSGHSFREQLVSRILEPLGMTETVPGPDVLDKPVGSAGAPTPEMAARYARLLERLAKPYTLYGADENILSPYPPRWIGSSAGLLSTVVDLTKFDIALDHDLLFAQATRDLAWTPARANDGTVLPYGLGWFIQEVDGTKLVWHYGQWPIFSGLIMKVPERRLALILLANSAGMSAPFPLAETGDLLTSPFALAFMRTFVHRDADGRVLAAPAWRLDSASFSGQLAQLEAEGRGYDYRRESDAHGAILSYVASRVARVRRVHVVDPRSLDRWVGVYALDGRQTLTVTKKADGLLVEYPGQQAVDLFPESETEFFVKVADTRVTFVHDQDGRATHLLLRLSGNERKAIKIDSGK
jgi:CubicO group peptidase (beta-lactamase class C family)